MTISNKIDSNRIERSSYHTHPSCIPNFVLAGLFFTAVTCLTVGVCLRLADRVSLPTGLAMIGSGGAVAGIAGFVFIVKSHSNQQTQGLQHHKIERDNSTQSELPEAPPPFEQIKQQLSHLEDRLKGLNEQVNHPGSNLPCSRSDNGVLSEELKCIHHNINVLNNKLEQLEQQDHATLRHQQQSAPVHSEGRNPRSGHHLPNLENNNNAAIVPLGMTNENELIVYSPPKTVQSADQVLYTLIENTFKPRHSPNMAFGLNLDLCQKATSAFSKIVEYEIRNLENHQRKRTKSTLSNYIHDLGVWANFVKDPNNSSALKIDVVFQDRGHTWTPFPRYQANQNIEALQNALRSIQSEISLLYDHLEVINDTAQSIETLSEVSNAVAESINKLQQFHSSIIQQTLQQKDCIPINVIIEQLYLAEYLLQLCNTTKRHLPKGYGPRLTSLQEKLNQLITLSNRLLTTQPYDSLIQHSSDSNVITEKLKSELERIKKKPAISILKHSESSYIFEYSKLFDITLNDQLNEHMKSMQVKGAKFQPTWKDKITFIEYYKTELNQLSKHLHTKRQELFALRKWYVIAFKDLSVNYQEENSPLLLTPLRSQSNSSVEEVD